MFGETVPSEIDVVTIDPTGPEADIWKENKSSNVVGFTLTQDELDIDIDALLAGAATVIDVVGHGFVVVPV